MCEKITIIIMELLGEDQDDETDSAETRLLGWGGENCLCVCRKSWERDLLSGWTPSIEKPVSRAKPAKTLLSFSNARKPEGKVGTTEYGFVFRHYEKTDRYIEQYRENHSSACLQEETEWIPVLGVDVPDPYLLPTISSSSDEFDRVKLIEVMSDYLKVASMRSDLQKICLTGKRPADGGDQKRAPSNSTQRDNRGLPLIVAPSYTNKVSTEKVIQKELIISLDDKKEKRIDDDKNRTAPVLSTASSFPTVQPKQGSLHGIREKPVSTSARGRSKDENRLFHRERIRLPKFQWTEHHVKNKKVVSQERGVEATNGEKRDVKQPEFISTSDSDDSVPRQLTSRGSLRLGSNVQCRKSVSKKTPSHVSLSKCEVYSSTLPNAGERLQKYSQTGTRRSDETAFIQIFGQQTGPPPKVANKARTKVTEKGSSSRKAKSVSNQNLPFHCLTKFGRSNFHHVLEARSFKPGERKLGATAVADFRS